MAFTSGSTTDYKDLLGKLKDFLDTNGWTINSFAAGASLTDVGHLYVTGPGQVGGQPVNVSIQTANNPALNAYAWKVCGHTTYDSGADFGNQPTNGPIHYLLLWPNAMDYWFYVNDRRFIVVAKIGTYFMSMYAGFFLPYAQPDEYPYPFYVGATFNALDVYNRANSGVRSFMDPGIGGASYLPRQSLAWLSLTNSGDADNVVDNHYSIGNSVCTWPLRQLQANDTAGATDDIAWTFFANIRPLKNGNTPMWQVNILDGQNNCLAGVLDGVFVTSGFNRAPEQVVSVDAQDYRLFINVNRNDPKHYFAVEES